MRNFSLALILGRPLLSSLILLLLGMAPTLAQGSPAYDGLTVLGAAPKLTDEQGSTLTLVACHTKYKEPVVGFYFVQNGIEVRFYANAATWDKLKQKLIKARDQWATLAPREFEMEGAVKGYQIKNRVSTLRLSLIGETDLADRRLQMSATGGAAKPQRAMVALRDTELKALVEDFYQIDDYFRAAGNAGQPPAP